MHTIRLLFLLVLTIASSSSLAISETEQTKAINYIEKSFFIPNSDKKEGNTVYVFVDPNCPACKTLWKYRDEIEDAGYQLNWIISAVIEESSMNISAKILNADNELKAMDEYFSKRKLPESEDDFVDSDIYEYLHYHNDLLNAMGVEALPFTVKLNNANPEFIYGINWALEELKVKSNGAK